MNNRLEKLTMNIKGKNYTVLLIELNNSELRVLFKDCLNEQTIQTMRDNNFEDLLTVCLLKDAVKQIFGERTGEFDFAVGVADIDKFKKNKILMRSILKHESGHGLFGYQYDMNFNFSFAESFLYLFGIRPKAIKEMEEKEIKCDSIIDDVEEIDSFVKFLKSGIKFVSVSGIDLLDKKFTIKRIQRLNMRKYLIEKNLI